MPRTAGGLYDFGPFRLNPEQRLLTREHHALTLAPKTFDLLTFLVEHQGRVLSKQELMHALWPDTFVEEANLSFQISVLRRTLGEDGARWIETVPKHGYRFVADVRATTTSDTPRAEPVGSIELEHHPEIPSRRMAKAWLGGGMVTVGLLALIAFFTVARNTDTTAVTPSTALAVPLTAYPGFEELPSLSADGSRVAFSWNGPTLDNPDIYVKSTGPGEPIRLTTNPGRDDSPAWSPDGRFIAFLRFMAPRVRTGGPERADAADLIVIPALGGAERTVATIFPSFVSRRGRPLRSLTWTPDGRWLAFGGSTSPDGGQGIWLISGDGVQRRRLTEAPKGGYTDLSPGVSADGRYLAFLRYVSLTRPSLFLLSLTPELERSGAPRQLTDNASTILGFAWTPDGRDLVYSSSGHLGLSRTATIPAASPTNRTAGPRFLPFGESAAAISISGTGQLVYSAHSRDTTLFELDVAGISTNLRPLPAVSSTFDEHTPHYSPDGKQLAFASTRSGSEEIWIANRDGSNLIQLTFIGGPQCSNPQWAPDGRSILFNSRRDGSADLYLIQPGVGTLTKLTNDPADEGEARWSRDGRWIYFGSNRTGRLEIWRMPAAGGPPTQITRQGGLAAIESRDGFLYYSKDAGIPSSIWRVPVDGGAEVRIADGLSYSSNFVLGERGLYFLATGSHGDNASVDFVDLATGQRSTVVRLDKPFWVGMAMQPDERAIVFSLVDSAGSNLMFVNRLPELH
jgi:Tol biopolymer transport system component/DNA-binding winged helix-turn-helix (wHTH) protein